MKLKLIFAVWLALLTANCSDDTTLTTPAPVRVSKMVTAAEGGEVALQDATLTIPAGALAKDTVITIDIRQPDDTVANAVVKGVVYEFGPNGLKFNEPAVLAMAIEPSGFATPGAVTKFNPNLGLWDEFGPTGSEYNPNLGLWDQTGDSGSNYNPNLGLWDMSDPNMMSTGVTGFSSYATTRPTHGVYSCGVDQAGSPCCWGLRESDCSGCAPADPLPTSSDFIEVAAGAWSDCGLKGDGTIQCWGSNPPVPPAGSGFVQVSTGRGHACGLKSDGSVVCFMAEGLEYEVPSPSDKNIVAVTAGDFHACALRATGEVFCWGPARDGEGDAPSGTDFTQVDAGARHTCAVTTAGALKCWGSDISGIKRVPTADTFVQVSVGVFAACALTDAGSVVCWGADYDVVTGTPSQDGYVLVITRHRQACAVREDGSMQCWGQDINGSLAPPAGCGMKVDTMACEIGYAPDETGCVDIDECQDPNVCGMNATCTNTSGSYDCACDDGFIGDGITCMPTGMNIATAIAAGSLHNCALRSGAIWCWGENIYGQLGNNSTTSNPVPVQVGSSNDWTTLASGGDHNCAVNAGGELWCWGANFGGMLGNGSNNQSSALVREATNATNWVEVTAGALHTCALNTAGEIYCWGDGLYGQLGDGILESQQTRPTRESTNATNWATVVAGSDHTCALDTMGNLSCWGANIEGQLGNQMSGTNSPNPIQIGGGPWDKIALGGAHTCATRSGELYCWGANLRGQLGIGGSNGIDIPTRVGTDTDWAMPAAGADSTCALRTSGALWCWGANPDGQLGTGDTNDQNTPTRTGMAGDWTTVAMPAMGSHTCGLKESGAVLCWGANFAGQLGVESSRLIPGAEVAMGNWTSVSAFGGQDASFTIGVSSYSCGVKQGAPWCWGDSAHDTSLTDTAAQVTGTLGDTGWTTISSSSSHVCGLQNGAPRCWGDNTSGALGDGSNTASSTPAVVQGTTTDTNWTVVSAGGGFSCGVKAGALWCWGRGDEYQLGDGRTVSTSTPIETGLSIGNMWSAISTGETHACGIHNQELYCWGNNEFGQVGNGMSTPETQVPAMPTVLGTSFSSVAAGKEHTCAIDITGNLLCTGNNAFGELGNNSTTPTNTFVEVGASQAPWSNVLVGRDHTCGVANGIAYCWGSNQFGQLGNGTIIDASTPVAVSTTFTDWVEVSPGDVFTCGRRVGGQVYCWGDNGLGQMGDGSFRFLTPQQVALP